jgi:hypothetical protein
VTVLEISTVNRSGDEFDEWRRLLEANLNPAAEPPKFVRGPP